MNLYESIFLSLFDLISYLIISNKIMMKKFSKKYWLIAFLFTIFTGSENYLLKGGISTLISAVLIVIMIYIVLQENFLDTLYIYLLSTISILCVQFLTLLPLYLIFGNLLYSFKIGLAAQLINLTLVLFLANILPLYKLYTLVITRNKRVDYMVANTFLMLFALVIYWEINIHSVIENIISIFILLISIIIINLLIIYNNFRTQRLIDELKVQQQYSPIIDELIKDIQSKQHDFNNHLQALRMIMLTSSNTEDIRNYFDQYLEQISFKSELNNLLEINNKVVSSFLYCKKLSAEKLGIPLTINIKYASLSKKIYDFEWIEILGILIDNALETNVENNSIEIIFDKEKNMNCIIVKNKHPYINHEIIESMFHKGKSTKSVSNRGYGLYNLKKVVEKYHGHIEVYNESNIENYVGFKILLS